MRSLISLVAVLSASTLLSACQPDNSANQQVTRDNQQQSEQSALSETERLNEWFAKKYEEELLNSPLMMTFLGRKDKYDQFDSMSREDQLKDLARSQKNVDELQTLFNYELLTDEGKASYDIWVMQNENAKQAEAFHKNGYVFTQMQGMQAFLTQFLINFHKVETESDMQAYISRIHGVGVALDNLLDQAKENAVYGVRPPRFAYEGVIDQASKIVTGAPFDKSNATAPLWSDAQSKIQKLVSDELITAEQAAMYTEQTKEALLGGYKTAYDNLIQWFESDIENTDVIATGVGKLPNGEAYYNMRLKASTTTDLTANEVHDIGLKEVARLTAEMEAIKEKVGFEGTLKEFFKFVKEDKQFYYPDTDEGRLGYIADSEKYLDFINEKLPEYFGILPKADLVVKRVEAFREQPGAAQHYFPGTPDGSRPGVYYAHLSDMSAMPKNEMEAIAYHEGNPGHHMQISIAQELTSVPQFRTQARFTAYSEGWGLYSELLAKEMGAYQNDFSDFGRLVTEIWRAVRLVVDTGLHTKGWTEQEAIDYFADKAPVPYEAIVSEVRRYIVWPGQATAYKIGMLEILALREEAKQILGDKFDIRGFHDTVLGGGALPMSILKTRVQAWVAKVKAS